ncbi:unnamed protein product [Enterobius vermicularis]|uniref:Transposase n=1 Tax=Enterobius vermicularis TaxID=51028 RepID=A0A0N4VDV0_ENTVE|nr:unnamed protein product [Enterobius vermicularis]
MIMVQEDQIGELKKRIKPQRDSTADSTCSDGYRGRKKRLTMPMTYRLYESQQENLRGTIFGPDSPDFHPEVASSMLRKALQAGLR